MKIDLDELERKATSAKLLSDERTRRGWTIAPTFVGQVVKSITLEQLEADPAHFFPARMTIEFEGGASISIDIQSPMLIARPDGSRVEGPFPVPGLVWSPGP